jgi:geranylgeranyl pyrophosphate synthase
MTSAREDSKRLWIMPFLGQLTDDCRDFNDDLRSTSVTPFTYYASLMERKDPFANDLLNPFYTFLNLCSDIYVSSNRDGQTGAFLGRRIARTLRAIEVSGDEASYLRFLNLFCSDNISLHDYCWNKLRKQFSFVTDPEKTFFRAMDASGVRFSRTNRKLDTYVCENLTKIEDALTILPLTPQTSTTQEEEILISAMNYSVKAGGKRLRPLLMFMVADLYGIELNKILPLTCGIEYLHTSSLILDDLPAQDNSDLRRGRPSLHKTTINGDIPMNLCEGRAQLAAVDLIAISMNLINHGLIKNGFSSDSVNQVVGEISLLMHDLCIGQMMDLRAARAGIEHNSQEIEKLDQIAWYKTGKTIEVVLITPVILAKSSSQDQTIELSRIRELSRLMGILFQMRDDLLDFEGGDDLGKPTSLDVKNNTVTYVSVLGAEDTRIRLQQFLTQALQLVDDLWPIGTETIKDVVRHIVARKT